MYLGFDVGTSGVKAILLDGLSACPRPEAFLRLRPHSALVDRLAPKLARSRAATALART
jgi:hypothetical protein